jgi:Uma2 family endonuclease
MATYPKDTPRRYYTLEEYFALEHAGEARYEYWDGEIVCMSGGAREHSRISSNVHYRLRQGLEGSRCIAFTADQAVKTPTLLPYRYPDASVACGDLAFENIRGVDVLVNPVLIVEVLSPTSAMRDHEEKFVAYQAISTFNDYLLIAQDTTHITHYARTAGGMWARRDIIDQSGLITFQSIGCSLAIADIYEGVSFPV